jgi:hypothetical protein
MAARDARARLGFDRDAAAGATSGRHGNGAETVTAYREPPPSALARGPAKSTDIQRIRRELRGAELCEARRLQAAAARHRRQARRAEQPAGP